MLPQPRNPRKPRGTARLRLAPRLPGPLPVAARGPASSAASVQPQLLRAQPVKLRSHRRAAGLWGRPGVSGSQRSQPKPLPEPPRPPCEAGSAGSRRREPVSPPIGQPTCPDSLITCLSRSGSENALPPGSDDLPSRQQLEGPSSKLGRSRPS